MEDQVADTKRKTLVQTEKLSGQVIITDKMPGFESGNCRAYR